MRTLRSRVEQNLGWFILIVLGAGCLFVMRPFVSALVWAAILCFSSWPIYGRLLIFVGNRRTLAAALMAIGLVLIVLCPFAIVGFTLADQVKDLTVAVQKWADAGPPAPPEFLHKLPLVGARAVDQWQNLAQDSAKFMAALRHLIEPASAYLLTIAVSIGGGLLHLALSLFICFFLFRDGAWAAEQLSAAVVRIGGDHAVRLLTLAGSTIRGVVYGVLGTALFQGILAGIGFLVAGIPGAGVLALLTLFFSMVPLGPLLVALPGAFWLYRQGSTAWAIFIVIWGVGVGTVDNFVKPWLISRGTPMPFLLILFGALGGAIGFGFIGVFLGPTLLAVGYRIFQEWLAQRGSPEPTAAIGPSAGVLPRFEPASQKVSV
jgi:predicted PurR-regulated permease PerM